MYIYVYYLCTYMYAYTGICLGVQSSLVCRLEVSHQAGRLGITPSAIGMRYAKVRKPGFGFLAFIVTEEYRASLTLLRSELDLVSNVINVISVISCIRKSGGFHTKFELPLIPTPTTYTLSNIIVLNCKAGLTPWAFQFRSNSNFQSSQI